MGDSLFDALAGMGMLASFIMLVISLLFFALVLCLAFRVVLGYMPSYPRALAALVLMVVAAAAVMTASGLLLPGNNTCRWLPLLAGFLVGIWAVNQQMASRDGSRIGYAKACLVQLGFTAVGFVLIMAISAMLASTYGTSAVPVFH